MQAITSSSMWTEANFGEQKTNIFGSRKKSPRKKKSMKTDVGHHKNKSSQSPRRRLFKMMMRRGDRNDDVNDVPNDHGVVQKVEEPTIQGHPLPDLQLSVNIEKTADQRETACNPTKSDWKLSNVEKDLSDSIIHMGRATCDAKNVVESHRGIQEIMTLGISSPDDEVVHEYNEDPSSDFTSDSFLNVSVDSEEDELLHPFDELELSVSSDEEKDDDGNQEKKETDGDSGSKPIPKASSGDADIIKPSESAETLSSNGDSVSTESTTSLSTEDSPPNTAELGFKVESPPVTKPPIPAKSIANIPCSTRQEPCPQRSYQSARIIRPLTTPCSFRSERFHEYLVSFLNQDADQQSPILRPPAGGGNNLDDRYESVLDRPFRYWKALDQVFEYSHPEWLTHQRGRMIHYLIHFLELKVGFQDYAVDIPRRSSGIYGSSSEPIPLTMKSGGGRLMPSPVVDEAWRALVLESTLYEKITRDLQEFHGQPTYQYIHYSRVKTMMNSGRTQGIPEELTTTQSLFQIYFREFMPASIRQVRTTPSINRNQLSSPSINSSPRASKNQFHSYMNSRHSEGNLRGLECLEPTSTNTNKKRVLWC